MVLGTASRIFLIWEATTKNEEWAINLLKKKFIKKL